MDNEEDIISPTNVNIKFGENNPKDYNPPRLSIESLIMDEKPESNTEIIEEILPEPNIPKIRTSRITPIIRKVEKSEPGFEIVYTDYGNYEIPIYANMTPEELLIHRNTFILKFEVLNNTWSSTIGRKFAMPSPDEPMRNIHVRFKQSIEFIKAKNGTTMYMMIHFLASLVVEASLGYFGIDAEGFTLAQWRIKDMYESFFIELGESKGFGVKWDPLTTICVISVVNLAVFILIGFITNGDKEKAMQLSNTAVSLFVGNMNNQEYDEHGIPIPRDDLVGTVIGNLGVNSIASNLMNGLSGFNMNPTFNR